jgi:SnoaL-like domain
MDAVERLEAVEEIRQLKARYFRCMDTKDWDGFALVFAPDAVMDMSEESGSSSSVTRGAIEIAAMARAGMESVQTVHHGHMSEIEITSSTTARGTWAMEDLLRWMSGPVRSLHGYGHYHDTYERIEGRWLIKSTSLTRLRTDVEMNRMDWNAAVRS